MPQDNRFNSKWGSPTASTSANSPTSSYGTTTNNGPPLPLPKKMKGSNNLMPKLPSTNQAPSVSSIASRESPRPIITTSAAVNPPFVTGQEVTERRPNNRGLAVPGESMASTSISTKDPAGPHRWTPAPANVVVDARAQEALTEHITDRSTAAQVHRRRGRCATLAGKWASLCLLALLLYPMLPFLTGIAWWVDSRLCWDLRCRGAGSRETLVMSQGKAVLPSPVSALRNETLSSGEYVEKTHLSKRVLCDTDYLNCAIQPAPRDEPFFADVERRRWDNSSGPVCPSRACVGMAHGMPCYTQYSDYLHQSTAVTEAIARLFAQYVGNLTQYIGTADGTMDELRQVAAAKPWWVVEQAQYVYTGRVVGVGWGGGGSGDEDAMGRGQGAVGGAAVRVRVWIWLTRPAWAGFRAVRWGLAVMGVVGELQVNVWERLVRRLQGELAERDWATGLQRSLQAAKRPCVAAVERLPMCAKEGRAGAIAQDWMQAWAKRNLERACLVADVDRGVIFDLVTDALDTILATWARKME